MLASLVQQPKAVFLLAFVQLWNRFSHYGMRALLLLYMIKVLKTPDPVAIGIFAVYCALVELGGVFGAYLAEKFLGLRSAVMLGGWLIWDRPSSASTGIELISALGFVILGSSLYTNRMLRHSLENFILQAISSVSRVSPFFTCRLTSERF